MTATTTTSQIVKFGEDDGGLNLSSVSQQDLPNHSTSSVP
jgi:hypothetical protein